MGCRPSHSQYNATENNSNAESKYMSPRSQMPQENPTKVRTAVNSDIENKQSQKKEQQTHEEQLKCIKEESERNEREEKEEQQQEKERLEEETHRKEQQQREEEEREVEQERLEKETRRKEQELNEELELRKQQERIEEATCRKEQELRDEQEQREQEEEEEEEAQKEQFEPQEEHEITHAQIHQDEDDTESEEQGTCDPDPQPEEEQTEESGCETGTEKDEPASEMSEYEAAALFSHNKYRSRHEAPPLSLSRELCEMAQRWVDELKRRETLERSPSRSHREYKDSLAGESLLESEYKDDEAIMAETQVQIWYEEGNDYDYTEPDAETNSGHFSQLVWRDTQEMGIAFARVGDTVITCAHYYPPGNIQGAYPDNVLPEV